MSTRAREREPKISRDTEKMAGRYLFDISDFDSNQALDMRTRVRSESMMNVLMFYGVMGEGMDSEISRKIKGILERLLIAFDGGGRTEAVDVLRQNFPKRIIEERGYEDMDALRERVKKAQDKT